MNLDPRQAMVRDSRIIVGLLSILSIMGFGAVLYQVRTIVLPFALAVFLSYILNPLISFFEKRRVPVPVSILIAVLITFVILGVLGVMINESIQSFAREFPKYETRFGVIIDNLIAFFRLPPELFSSTTDGSQRFQMLTGLDKLSVTELITNTLSSITKFLSNTVLVLLFLLFILMGRNQLIKKIELAFDDSMSEKLVGIATNINQQIQKYIIAKTLISLATAFLVTVVLYSFGVKFALIWGIMTFLLNFIPSIGSVIATLLPATITVIQFENYLTIFLVVILLVVIQFVMGNLIDPKVVGGSVNLSPLVILFSLIFWGWLWGIVGMFLAVPLSVLVKIVFENIQSLRFISVLMSARE
ncbi:MAG: AI-2E family transporter [Calditrichaeota bacterium]|nr:AI-2E family transporter [Calditrichota bacterium]